MPIRIPVAVGLAALFPASIMTLAAQIQAPDLHNKVTVRREMMAFNPRYLALVGPRFRALRELEQQVMKREAEMRDVSCSHQIVTELRWLMGSTVGGQKGVRYPSSLHVPFFPSYPARERGARGSV